MSKPTYDVIIIGAGAAGLMCAAQAGQGGKKVLLIDHADKVGKKILISGGGRCNFTNIFASPSQYISENPHFSKSALWQFSAQDFIELVDYYHIPWHEKTLGQLFCDGSSREIVAMLKNECSKGNVEIRLERTILNVVKEKHLFRILTNQNTLLCSSLVIATGGPSIPKMGATNFAFTLAEQFNIEVETPRPALVPLTLTKEDQAFKDLSGVSTEAIITCGKAQFQEALLFTHKGMSGPAVLQISSYWKPGLEITINFLPQEKKGWLLSEKQNSPQIHLKRALTSRLPKRLAETINKLIHHTENLGNISDKSIRAIEEKLFAWRFLPSGSEGFKKAEVTRGGVSTKALSSKTMEVRDIPGLYFIGEAVDVTGWLGGYNFQWAWSSGYAAAKALAS